MLYMPSFKTWLILSYDYTIFFYEEFINCRTIHVAVSYTHLDVYKRQRGHSVWRLIVDWFSRRSVFGESDKNALIWLAVITIIFTPKSDILIKYLVFYQISLLGSGLCDVSTSVKNNWKVSNYNNFLIKRPIVTGVMSLNYRHFPL